MGDNGSPILDGPIPDDSNKSNPENLININDLVIAVRRGENGKIETLINSTTRIELEIALVRLTHQCFGVFNAMSFAQQKENAPKIQTSGIMNFVRRKR